MKLHIISPETYVKGGPGSGFHGHAGRPGEVGGSAPAGSMAGDAPVSVSSWPSMAEMKAGKWKELDSKSSASKVWQMTTPDGKKWFVKQPSTQFDEDLFDEISSELAADVLGREMGLPVVPVKFLSADSDPFLADKISGDGQLGVLMYPWLDDIRPYASVERNLTGNAYLTQKNKVEFGLFDFLIRNSDRHKNNLIFMPDGQPLLIDHGLAFNKDDEVPGKPFYWHDADAYAEPVTDAYLRQLERGIKKAQAKADDRTMLRIDFAAQRFKLLRQAVDRVKKAGRPVNWSYVKGELPDY